MIKSHIVSLLVAVREGIDHLLDLDVTIDCA